MNRIYALLISFSLSLNAYAQTATTESEALTFPTSVNETVPVDRAVSQPHHIALLLPLSGPQAKMAQTIRDGFLAAYYQQKPIDLTINLIDTTKSSTISTAYDQALEEGADFIVGPLDKKDVAAIENLASNRVPVLALNYTQSTEPKQTSWYEFGLSPTDEAEQVAEKAWEAGYRTALTITPAGNWGENIQQAFETRWKTLGGRVVDKLAFTQTTSLETGLQRLLHVTPATNVDDKSNPPPQTQRHDADCIFLVASPTVARQINPLLKFYGAGRLPIYSTSLVYAGTPTPAADHDLDGIIFADMPATLLSIQKSNVVDSNLLSEKSVAKNLRLFALGIDAYRLATHLDDLRAGHLSGVTGDLSINDQQQILRRLRFAQFRDGHPSQISLTP